jgi:hypothetical protein
MMAMAEPTIFNPTRQIKGGLYCVGNGCHFIIILRQRQSCHLSSYQGKRGQSYTFLAGSVTTIEIWCYKSRA